MSNNLVTFTDSNFETEVLHSKEPVLVDFWATWCQPCLALTPIIEEIAHDYQNRLKIGKLNVDENPQTQSRYMIFSIPTLILFKNGEIQEQVIGFKPKAELVRLIESLLPPAK
ncbi:MAG: thioredoxin [Candidatus Fischerbacteria bacterium RBG_13_37_8]|uniref:Thioredoxin n=1 Tax=Candidatus Fischerbacteria bacterium RBG_13_37_8 TaxID=1817863 RepID=A0A1F5VTS4_9BACT|nr:MAG: thioredoxin [Candidatus Fischerbacteria bacterium RBG_13_37_8]